MTRAMQGDVDRAVPSPVHLRHRRAWRAQVLRAYSHDLPHSKRSRVAATRHGVPAHAAIKVLATTTDWGALATELGGDRVNVYTATSALQDVHRVEAKPSLIARARSAELLIANGAELEVGWLPVLMQESGNSRIQPGKPGYFEAAAQVKLLEVPSQPRSIARRYPSARQPARAARPPQHRRDCESAHRSTVDDRSGGRRSTPNVAKSSMRAGRRPFSGGRARLFR